MSAPAGPGRTWRTIVVERELPVLARAIAAGVLGGCSGLARVPGLGSAAEASVSPNLGDQDDFWRELGPQYSRDRDLGRALVSLSLVPQSARFVRRGCDQKDVTMLAMRKPAAVGLLAMLVSLSASAQVEKVVADAEGIT